MAGYPARFRLLLMKSEARRDHNIAIGITGSLIQPSTMPDIDEAWVTNSNEALNLQLSESFVLVH